MKLECVICGDEMTGRRHKKYCSNRCKCRARFIEMGYRARAIHDREYEKRYRRTKGGWIARAYGNQTSGSKRRGLEYPKYSSSEFKEWVLKQPNFDKLFVDWVASDFDRKLCPSVDRIDHKKPYQLDNIQLMTVSENASKGMKETRVNWKTVEQYSINGEFINSYVSGVDAERALNIPSTNILKAAKGGLKTAGGFVWKYK